MINLKSIDGLEGKTIFSIKFICCDQFLSIIFTDRTYVFIQSTTDRGYDDDCELFVYETPSNNMLLEAGVITKAQLELINKKENDVLIKINKKEVAEFKASLERNELAELARLTKKYRVKK